MRAMRILSVVLAALAVRPALSQTEGSASAPASRPASAPADMGPFLAALREANSPAAAARAYANGCRVDRRNVELNRAYLRRLLQLGQTALADIPAGALAALGAGDSLAHETLCYNRGLRGELGTALYHALKAAEADSNAPAVLDNLGQLVGWYEGARTIRFNAEVQRLLDRVKGEVKGKPAFAAAYQPLVDAYYKRDSEIGQNQQAATLMSEEVRQAKDKGLEIQAQLNEIRAQIADHEKAIADLRRQLADSRKTEADRRWLEARVRDEQYTIYELNRKATPVETALLDAFRAYKEKKGAQEAVRNRPVAPVPLAQFLRWLPPSADGPASRPARPQARPTATAPAP